MNHAQDSHAGQRYQRLSRFHFERETMDTLAIKRPFWTWVFCETDGTPSFARIGTAVLCAFAVGWITAIVRWSHALPELGGVSIFVTMLYGANKFTAMWKKD